MGRVANAIGLRAATLTLRTSGRVRHCRPLLVTGAARSGTTWLGEVVADALGLPMLFEPDHPRHAIAYAQRPRIGLDPDTAALYRRVLRGRVVPLGSTRHAVRALRTPGVVIKSIHAVPHLPVLASDGHELHAVLVVRHPGAVVASRLRHTGFAPKRPEDVVTPELLAVEPTLVDARDRARSPAQRHALRWAVDHLAVAKATAPWWHGVAHEVLRSEEDVLRRLLESLADGELMARSWRTDRPSATAWSTGAGADDWREQLGPAGIREILEITRSVGIGWYDEDPLPVLPIPGMPST